MIDKLPEITKEEIEKFRECGLLDETGLIYYVIRREYKTRTEAEPGKKKNEIISEITEEMQRRGYPGSFDAVTKIIYSDRKKRSTGLDFENNT